MSGQLLAEIVDVAGVTPRGWTVFSVTDDRWFDVLRELQLEMGEAEDLQPVRTVDGSAEDIINAITKGPQSGTVLLLLRPPIPTGSIAALDAGRGRLVAGPRIVTLTTNDGAREIARTAPNLWSWVGARHFGAVALSPQIDCTARLQSLHKATGLTDTQVREAHSLGQLPADPIFAEWLSLLESVEK